MTCVDIAEPELTPFIHCTMLTLERPCAEEMSVEEMKAEIEVRHRESMQLYML
jgi:hypothetical protein